MASFTANVGDDYIRQLEALGRDADRVARRALEESADILADTILQNLEGLSEDIRTSGGKDYYYLTQNEFFVGVPSVLFVSMVYDLFEYVLPPFTSRASLASSPSLSM